ncbi:MAG: SDR family NAD(P)-dependent oxidoreductase [Bacteroidales bacterium]|nr:SDR family NAD(P)-dependent oxidoreductase [Bacteroidales bacterium]
MNQKVVLLTGASSGIGYETAIRLAHLGCKVYGAARRTERMEPLKAEGIIPLYLDVTDEASIQACVDAVIAAEGRIDVLVNNAGYGYFGAIENVTLEEARRQLEVNVFGLAALTRLVLPHMRAQGSGRIINLASIAGKLVLQFGGWYHVSKYAVEALSDALRIEVKPFGIDVVLIEPGGIRTNWGLIAADYLKESSAGTVYQTAADHQAHTMHAAYSSEKLLSPPSVIAKAICRAVRAKRPRVRYRTGFAAHSAVFFHSILPARWWDALMRQGGRKIL